jgi:hypothetical protein
MVRDLGSLNGTFVNNQRITEAPLPAGELLTVGTVTFRAMYDAVPAAAAPQGKAALAATKVEAKRAGAAAKPKQAAAAPTEVEELDFDFDKPLLSDDDDLLGETAHPTEALEGDAERSRNVAAKSGGNTPSKQPQSKPGKPAPLAATQAEDATIEVSSFEDDDVAGSDEVAGSDSDDEDLNDFLKTLGDK